MGKKFRVGDYVSLQRGTTYKGTLVGKPGPALLGLGSIRPGGGFRDGDYETYGGECPEKLMLFPGDLFVSLKGATKDGKMIGSIARVPSAVPSGRLTQDTVKLIFHDFDQDTATFLYWLLRTPQYRNYCAARATGSAVVALSRDDFLAYPVPPITPARMQLAKLFEAIDGKIELNRRMNETLEDTALALFKSWFVDFDPVRAKAEGRDRDLPKTIAKLFPSSFQESESGNIPKGWKVEKLSDLMTFQGGAQPPASQFIAEQREGYVRLVQIRDFYTDEHITYVPDSTKLRKFEADDVMIARYGSSGNAAKSADSLGRICRGLAGAYNVALVKVQTQRPVREFLYWLLRSRAFQAAIRGMGARSVQSGFRKEDLDMIPVVTGPASVHSWFEMFAENSWRRVFANFEQSKTLASLRDFLLPKLISGELPLPNAERIVGEQM
jgi:restriction endonuclease S subunit